MCKNQNLRVAGTYVEKANEKLITYKSGASATQLDLILWTPKSDVFLRNYTAIPGEECLTQHCLVRADFQIRRLVKKK